MTQVTNLPSRPTRASDPQQQIWTVWNMLQYFVSSVYDVFVNKFVQGSTTVPSTATTVVVTHSLGAAAYQVFVNPTQDPLSRWWISGKTSTQFTINLQTAAPVGGIAFDWMVKAA